MCVGVHESEKNNSFHCAKWLYEGWTSQGAAAIPEEAFAVSMLHTSTQKVPLPLRQRRQAGLRRVFLTPQACC